MKNKRILITGGTGYLGHFLVGKYYTDNNVTVFSRDEAKQVFLKKKFPGIRTILGDVRDGDMLSAAVAGHDFSIFAASMKHVGEINANVGEAAQIILQGALNARRAARIHGLEAAVFVSTDKSRFPTTIYGAMKFVAGEAFIWDSDRLPGTRLSATICGNIINSTGSIIPMIWNAIKTKTWLTLYSENMSRFTITGDEVADLIDFSLGFDGVSIVPKLRSFMIRDLFEIFAEQHGLQYQVGSPANSVEREAELLVSKDDAARTKDVGDRYLSIHHKKKALIPATLINGEYSSQDHLMAKHELDDMLVAHDYFRP